MASVFTEMQWLSGGVGEVEKVVVKKRKTRHPRELEFLSSKAAFLTNSNTQEQRRWVVRPSQGWDLLSKSNGGREEEGREGRTDRMDTVHKEGSHDERLRSTEH